MSDRLIENAFRFAYDKLQARRKRDGGWRRKPVSAQNLQIIESDIDLFTFPLQLGIIFILFPCLPAHRLFSRLAARARAADRADAN